MRLLFAPFSMLVLSLPVLLAGCSDSSSSGSDPGVRPLPPPTGELIFDRYQPLGQDQAIILDTHTWLAWERCARGQTWSYQDQICIGEPDRLSFGEANAIRDNAFELPTLEQLKSLVYCPSLHPTSNLIGQLDLLQGCPSGDPRPAIHPKAFPDTPIMITYWSATPSDFDGLYLGISFEYGLLNDFNPPSTHFAHRLVRDASELKPETPPEEPTPEPTPDEQ